MTQVFILGSSSVYGVGGSKAGWGDLIKQYFHQKMYDTDGLGEKCEVFNFAKSGAKIEFVKRNFTQQIKEYGRGQKNIIIVSVGGNNSKAEDTPNNFVSTPEDFQDEMSSLFRLLKEHSSTIIAVGNGYVDESKTNPKPNPLTGGKSYFTNKRRQEFNKITRNLCSKNSIDYVDITISEAEWLCNYIFEDGLHPNQAGHQLIFESVKPLIDRALT